MTRSDRNPTAGRPGGFTLIELLVVIAIIALLVSILMPSLKRAKDMAKAVACLVNQRSMGTGFSLYGSEWNNYIPHAIGDSDPSYMGAMHYVAGAKPDICGPKVFIWGKQVSAYSGEGAFDCPSQSLTGTDPAYLPQKKWGYGIIFWDYLQLANPPLPVVDVSWRFSETRLRVESFPQPAATINVADNVANYNFWNSGLYPANHIHTSADRVMIGSRFNVASDTDQYNKYFDDRHLKNVNALMMDGHAVPIGGEELFNQKFKASNCVWDGF